MRLPGIVAARSAAWQRRNLSSRGVDGHRDGAFASVCLNSEVRHEKDFCSQAWACLALGVCVGVGRRHMPRRHAMPAKAPAIWRRSTTGPASMSASTAAAASGRSDFSNALRHRLIRHLRRPGRRHARLQLADRTRPCSASKATSTGATSAAARLCAGTTCETRNNWLAHRARPARLRLRPLHALRHRRRRLRRHQDLDRRLRQRDDDQGRLDRRRRPRSRDRRPVDAPRSNISTSISAKATAVRLRRLDDANFRTNVVRAGINYRF